MTSRELTGLRSLAGAEPLPVERPWSDKFHTLLYGAIGWPWLLVSLWGGTRASKRRLLTRLDLASDALPHLGSWKADTGFLHRIVDVIEELRPQVVVELGSGASSLVCARALQLNGGGKLTSYDQHAEFVAATAQWLRDEGVDADMRHAPLRKRASRWPGTWYDLSEIPSQIDLLIIDGPPWAVHPFVRGAADTLFNRLTPGAIILLDDAARPGERVVARRWRRRWPDIAFVRLAGSTKGTLIGRKTRSGAQVVPFPLRQQASAMAAWGRAAAVAGLLAMGWIAHDISEDIAPAAQAASFVDEASASYSASLARQQMRSQLESTAFDRREIRAKTGLTLPALPANWNVRDVQVYPSDATMAVAIILRTDRGEIVSLFAKRAETPAEGLPMIEHRAGRSVAYWEAGPLAYALTGQIAPERVRDLSERLAVGS